MNKITKIALIGFIGTISFLVQSQNYSSIVTKEHNKYDIQSEPNEPDVPELPNDGFWIPLAMDVSNRFPAYADRSSSAQAQTRMNLGQLPWQGDNQGVAAYDPNFDSANFLNCTLDAENFCTSPNLQSYYYNKTHASGVYYFEVEVRGNPVADQIGMKSPTADKLHGVMSGSYPNYKNLSPILNSVIKLPKFHDTEYIQNGTVMQVWVDFDNSRMSIKKLGVDDLTYNY